MQTTTASTVKSRPLSHIFIWQQTGLPYSRRESMPKSYQDTSYKDSSHINLAVAGPGHKDGKDGSHTYPASSDHNDSRKADDGHKDGKKADLASYDHKDGKDGILVRDGKK